MAEISKQIQKNMNVICSETDISSYSKEEGDIYKEYIEKNSKILNIRYDKTSETAAKNGKNLGNSVKFKHFNMFKIDNEFKKDSFDACISKGVLEHFSKGQIRDIIDKQLSIAPIIIASFPVRTKRTLRYYGIKEINGKEVCNDKIQRNLWSEYQWKEDILKFYDIEESHIRKCSSLIGNFDELFVVIERDYTGEEFEGLVNEKDHEIRMAELFTGSYGWSEELSAFELYFMSCFEFPFKAKLRSSDYGDIKNVFSVIRITCCRDKGGVFCEIRFDDGIRKEVPVYSINPIDKKHKRNIALHDYIEWLPFKVQQ